MDKKNAIVFLNVTPAEKERFAALARQCGLSLVGLWRAMLAEMDTEPVIGWKLVRRRSQELQEDGAK